MVWQMTCRTYVVVHHIDTMFLFYSVQFALNALDLLKINFAWLRQRLVSFLQEDECSEQWTNTSTCLSIFFLEIDVCVIPLC